MTALVLRFLGLCQLDYLATGALSLVITFDLMRKWLTSYKQGLNLQVEVARGQKWTVIFCFNAPILYSEHFRPFFQPQILTGFQYFLPCNVVGCDGHHYKS
jgi:hypothetical protein